MTGATGFVGSAVVRKLIRSGYPVRAAVRASSDLRNLEELSVETVECDLTAPASMARALRGCRGLFHIAADYRLWVPDRAQMFAINVDGTRALMLAAADAGVERIVYTSSVATLGLVPGGAANEDTPSSLDDMIGPYKQSKFLAEATVRSLFEQQAVPVIIVNPSAPVGPRDLRPTPTGRMVLDSASGKMPAYVDTGLNVVHVDDVAEGHLQAYERGKLGDRYILGGQNMSLLEILTAIAKLTGRRPPRLRLPSGLVLPLAHVAEFASRLTGKEPFTTVDGVRLARKYMYFSIDKARRDLGYEARPAETALLDAINWFRDHDYLTRK